MCNLEINMECGVYARESGVKYLRLLKDVVLMFGVCRK